ncbi:MAG: type IV pilus secretin PilQ [Mariprofundales bacterium]
MLLLSVDSHASTITALELEKSAQGDVVRIAADEALQYQVFDMDSPPRVVLNLPKTKLADTVRAVSSRLSGVNSVSPFADKDFVRIEIILDMALDYNVEEQGNALLVRFSHSITEQNMQNQATGTEEANMPRASGAQLHELRVRDRGDITEVMVRGMYMDMNHNAFITNGGRNMIIDLWGATSALNKERFTYSSQNVRAVTVGQTSDRVRLIMDLQPSSNQDFQIDASRGALIVRIGHVEQKQDGVTTVKNVSFNTNNSTAYLRIKTDINDPIINLQERSGYILIDIKNSALADGQERSQDVHDFPGPVKQIDSYEVKDGVRIVARLREDTSTTSFQKNGTLTVVMTPVAIAQAQERKLKGDKIAYTGEKITFDFKDIDIRNALKLIAEMSSLNFIMSDDVSGKLTMRLVDVPWDQALDTILHSHKLGKEKIGNVIRIVPIDVLDEEYKAKLNAQKGSQRLEPLISEFIPLRYAKAINIKKTLQEINATKGAAGTAGQGDTSTALGVLSDRGSIMVDERTNMLIITDTEDRINNLKRLITAIDLQVQQVLIEARIVEASDNFSRDIGVRWGGAVNQRTQYNFPGSVAVGAVGGVTAANAAAIVANGNVAAATGQGFLVDMPASAGAGSGGAIGLSLGSFNNALNLNLELSAAETEGEIKLISSPRVVTANMKKAYIKQGTNIAITTPGTANAPATTELLEAVLSLEVTPQITADERIVMELLVTKNSPTIFNGASAIDTRELNTSISMKDGETVVIGGIFSHNVLTEEGKVPGLAEIPFLGWLFSKNLRTEQRTELLIFLTPHILRAGDASGLAMN